MRAADRLGTGSSFGSAGRGRSARGRAKAIAQGDVPAYDLVRLPLADVAPTPLNPRRNFGTDKQLERFGEELRVAQLAACVAVTRDVYLSLWPEHTETIGAATHVLVNGERRYRAAAQAGLEALDFVVRDDLAASREEFIDHLLKENLAREDFDVIERARGVQQLVDACAEDGASGARARAAQRLGRDRSWVTNQLSLLTLPEPIQALLSAGDMPERDGRLLARHVKENPGLDAPQLLAFLEQVREKQAAAREEEKAILQAAKEGRPQTPVLSADNNAAPSSPAAKPSAQGKQNLLSADNSRQSTEAGSEATVLSADNTTQPEEAEPEAAPPVLSADNNAPAVPHQTSPTRDSVVLRLADSPSDQAAALAAALPSGALTALIEELHAYV